MKYVDINLAWDIGTLMDWYMNSVDNTIPPIWTGEHLEELLEDFYLIPKDSKLVDNDVWGNMNEID